MSENVKVFVYGTLLTGESNHNVIKRHIIDSQNGIIIGRLYNTGSYPAVVLDETGYEIQGEWFTIAESALQDTDRLEGYYGPGKRNFYERVVVMDHNTGLSGYIYVWRESRGLEEITNGSWKQWHRKAALL